MVQVMLAGRLVKDPAIITTKLNSKQFLQFTVAAQIPERGEDGRFKANYFVCKVFGERGIALSHMLGKGDAVAVVGRMKELNYTKKDGTSGHILEVVVEDFDWNGRKETVKSGEVPVEGFGNIVPDDSNLDFE